MTQREIEKFEELFNHWCSTDVQLQTKNGDYGDGTQHNFIGFLMVYRKSIIEAVKAGSPKR